MKKWLIPLSYPFISIAAFAISGLLGVLGAGSGGIVIVLGGLIFYCAIVAPAICFIYSKRCMSGQKLRIFLTFYQSFLIALPFLIWFSFIVHENEPGMGAYSLIIFVWCELWSLIGLIKKRKTIENCD